VVRHDENDFTSRGEPITAALLDGEYPDSGAVPRRNGTADADRQGILLAGGEVSSTKTVLASIGDLLELIFRSGCRESSRRNRLGEKTRVGASRARER